MRLNTAAEILKNSYVGKHWRGELSLPVSYFVNGVIGAIVATAIALTIAEILFAETSPWSLFIGLALIWASVLAITVWQCVGIWRSSDQHSARGGSVFWATAAKVMVVLGIFQTGTIIAQNGIPQLHESFSILTGDPSVGLYEFRIVNAGTELEYIGGIPFGSSEKLEDLLNAAPDVHTIHFDSHGGRIAEAEKIYEIIMRRHLDTYVSHECLSACTIAYLGGANRYVHRSGRIGFHSSNFPGVPETELIAGNQQLASSIAERGVDSSFAKRAYLTPSDEMWYPTIAELLASGFATDIAEGQFALSGQGYNPSTNDFENLLLVLPVYEAMKALDANAFRQTVDVVYSGWKKGESENFIFSKTRSIFGSLLEQYVHLAADDAVVAFGNLLVAELDAIGSKNPLECYLFLFPEGHEPLDLAAYLEPELQARDLKVTEQVLSTAADRYQQTHSPGEIEDLFAGVLVRIAENHPPEVLQTLILIGDNDPSLRKEDACFATSVFYGEVLAEPHNQAAALLRAIFTPEP